MRRLAAAVALLAVGACSEGGDPVQMALRDASAARQAAALKGTGEVTPPAPAVSEDAVYVAEMIEHHRAAITVAVEALARSGDPEIRRLARVEIDSRTRDIAALQAWKPVEPGIVSAR